MGDRRFRRAAIMVLVVCVPILVVEMLALFGYREWFLRFGIFPRQTTTWWHIFLAPFLHASPSHCMSNLSVLSVLVGLLVVRNGSLFWLSSLLIIVVGGLGVWAFGRPAIHVGASGWIFGLWALLITRGLCGHCWRDVLVGAIVAILYWRLVTGLFPQDGNVSIEAHWFGALAGASVGFLSRKQFTVKTV